MSPDPRTPFSTSAPWHPNVFLRKSHIAEREKTGRAEASKRVSVFEARAGGYPETRLKEESTGFPLRSMSPCRLLLPLAWKAEVQE